MHEFSFHGGVYKIGNMFARTTRLIRLARFVGFGLFIIIFFSVLFIPGGVDSLLEAVYDWVPRGVSVVTIYEMCT